MAFWRATDVDLPNNSTIVTVNTGDDVGEMTTGYILQINSGQFLEVKNVNTGASPQTIELYQLYTGSAITGGSAISAPTQGAIKEATEEVRLLRQSYEGLADSVSTTNTASSLAKRDGSGRLEATAGDSGNDVLTFGNVTTSSTDNTADRLLKVGSFGAGLKQSNIPLITDFALSYPNGVYRAEGSTVSGGPAGLSGFAMSVVVVNTEIGTNFEVTRGTSSVKKFTGSRSSSTGTVSWTEVLTDSNTNLNVFGGIAAGDYIAEGYCQTTGRAIFTLPAFGDTTAAFSSTGVFDVKTTDGTNRGTGVGIAIDSTKTTNKWLYIFCTISGGVVDERVFLVTKTSTDKITVNP